MNMSQKQNITRRKFFKTGLVGLGGFALTQLPRRNRNTYLQIPEAEYLGRNTVYLPNTLPIRVKPSVDSNVVRILAEDECVVWLREVVGVAPIGKINRRWVETPEGYVYASSLQPVKNLPNQPVNTLPLQTDKGPGMWVEVTTPYTNLQIFNPPTRAPWLSDAPTSLWRLYYSQVAWVDEITNDTDGNILYRINERYGSYGDIFLADAQAFRPITQEEVSPIHPDALDKRIEININHQSLSCYEGNREVYYCQVSTGQKLDENGLPSDKWVTPVAEYWIWRKVISLHMSGGETGGGWDTMCIPWTSLFAAVGIAIHATHWHNDFGTPRSHGCVNVTPQDAKWIFRWTTPSVDFQVGDITDNTFTSTKIKVVEQLY